jgi:hypothetical protein
VELSSAMKGDKRKSLSIACYFLPPLLFLLSNCYSSGSLLSCKQEGMKYSSMILVMVMAFACLKASPLPMKRSGRRTSRTFDDRMLQLTTMTEEGSPRSETTPPGSPSSIVYTEGSRRRFNKMRAHLGMDENEPILPMSKTDKKAMQAQELAAYEASQRAPQEAAEEELRQQREAAIQQQDAYNNQFWTTYGHQIAQQQQQYDYSSSRRKSRRQDTPRPLLASQTQDLQRAPQNLLAQLPPRHVPPPQNDTTDVNLDLGLGSSWYGWNNSGYNDGSGSGSGGHYGGGGGYGYH